MYAITGATGHTGSVVANRLLTENKKVRAIGRHVDRLQPLVAKGAEPFACNLTDQGALTKAFTGAKAVYVMIPPSLTSQDFLADQERASDTLAAALEKSRTTHAVVLSSIGADKADNTGPVVGLHRLEEKLNRIAGLNVLYLRAGYFMENTLAQVGIIKTLGMAGGSLRPELKLPMIATRDIGTAAAEALLGLDFSRRQTRELLGQRDISMTEVTKIIGKAIEQPTLVYAQLSDERVREAMVQMGMSPNVADLLLELADALNASRVRALEERTAKNTTATSYETFVADEFVPRYRS
jgi:uncharacterized protein YbjT (DUF2867 family)